MELPHMNKLASEDFARLVERVSQHRDRESFTTLFDYFGPRINAYLQRLGLEASQAEELVQEVMIVLWHKAHLFDPAKSSLATWLFRIARNRRIDLVRRDRSHLLDPHDPIFQPSESEPVDEGLDNRQRENRIRKAIEGLPSEQVEMIRYAFFLGLTHSEISERTNLPLGTVKSRIRLAFSRLRRTLDADPLVDTEY
jgi:RNA polymerase sigma-70 factor (ECF subfamily)